MTPETVKKMVANPTRVVLSEKAFNKVVELCEKPAEPTPALVALMRSHRTKFENGVYKRFHA